jgi:glutamate dehydrogenase
VDNGHDIDDRGGAELSIVTGKPVALGGSKGRGEATARGCLFTIREACKVKKIKLKGARVAVQGFGNAGAIAARLLHEDGAKVIAVSDTRGGIFNPKGLDPVAALKHKEKAGSVQGWQGQKTSRMRIAKTRLRDTRYPPL